MRNSNNCGTELDDNAKFCKLCGEKQGIFKTTCLSCGAEISAGAKFCSRCGTKHSTDKKVCINCGAELQDGVKFCKECGTPIMVNNLNPSISVEIVSEKVDFTSCETLHSLEEEEINIDLDCDYKVAEDAISKKYGYKDKQKNWVISPRFDEATDFKGGFGRIKLNGKWGFIKPNGKYLIEPKFDKADSFYEGLASVKLNGKYGYINTNGNIVIEPKFDYAEAFSEGFAWVEKDNKYGFITNTGSYLVKPIFRTTCDFIGGKASVSYGDSFWNTKIGELYPDGTLVLEGEKMKACDLYGGIIKAKQQNNKKWGFVDVEGEWLISPHYDKVWDFGADEIALVEKDGKYGFILKDDTYLVEPIFENAQSFNNGFARFRENGKYGFIKTDGSIFVDAIFDEASYFDGGRVAVTLNGDPCYLYPDGTLLIGYQKMDIKTIISKNNASNEKENQTGNDIQDNANLKPIPFEDPEDGKWGYKDKDGDIVVMAMLDFAEEFEGDYARVIIGGNEMFIDKSGNLCHDKNGILFVPEEVEENEMDEVSYGTSAMSKKKSLIGKIAKKAWEGFKNSGGSSTSSESKNTVRKVWRCTYTGSHNAAPKVLDVPSENSSGRPTGREISAALKKMGFNDALAESISNGGSSACWKCE